MLFRKTPLAFCLRALLLLLALGLVTLTPPFERYVSYPLKVVNAETTRLSLSLLGVPAVRSGVFLYGTSGKGFSIEVIEECTGISLLIILLALTLAFPASWRSRAKCLVGGIILIFGLNLVRLVSLFIVGSSYPDIFHGVHVFFWQGLFILLVFVYWYVWASRSGRVLGSAPARPHPAP